MVAVRFAALALLAAMACTRIVDAPPKTSAINAASAWQIAIEPAKLQEIAREYQSWGRFDDEFRFGTTACFPQRISPGAARISESGDTRTHGSKLYYLYAKDREAYVDRPAVGQPVGQTIVKESFKPVEVLVNDPPFDRGDTNFPIRTPAYAEKDGKLWKPGDLVALFIMVRRGDANDPGTDDGWLYATTSMDGKTIWTNGPVSSCMSCHDESRDRLLFGGTATAAESRAKR